MLDTRLQRNTYMQLLRLGGQAQHGNTFTDYCNVRSQKKMKRFRSHWKILRTAMAKPPNRRAVASVKILPPADALETLTTIGRRVTTTILDPWYNKGVGGARPDYDDWLSKLIYAAARISEHVFIWGFPEIVYRQADRLPPGFAHKTW